MTDLDKLTQLILEFRDARNWKQFHKPKDMAISLALEASELLELFQWKSENEAKNFCDSKDPELANELADVLYWVLLMANDLGINLDTAVKNKLEINAKKYPVENFRDKAGKYNKT